MDFGTALALVKYGHNVARAGWSGTMIFLRPPDGSHPLTMPTILMSVGESAGVWFPTHTDLLATDWVMA